MEHSLTSQTQQLTDIQLQLWHMHLLSNESPALTLSVRYRLENIDPERWRAAFAGVFEEEPMLSLRVAGDDESPRLEATGSVTPPIVYLDYRGRSSDDLLRIANERRQLTIDPRERLMDTLLVREDDGVFSWFFNVHHLIADGWAVKVIVDRTMCRYRGEPISGSSSAARKYATELLEYEVSRDFEADRKYWEVKLERPFLPTDFYDLRDGHSPHLIRLRSTVDRELTARIRGTFTRLGGAQQNPAIAGFFATIVALFLHKMTGESYLSLGMPYANRNSPERKEAVGLFMRIGVLRVTVDPEESFSSLFSKLLADGRETANHLRYPLSNRGNRLYDVMVNLHNVSYQAIEGVTMTEEWLRSGNDSLPLTLHVRTTSIDKLVLELDLQEERFPPESREWVLRQLGSLIRQAASDPDSPITSFRLEGRPAALPPGPTSPAATYSPRRLEARFRELLPSVIGAPAVHWQGRQITFGELDERADRIGRVLTEQGCGAGSIVGVHLSRSIGAVVAILGILKSGAAWLPLDPEYPEELLRFMVEDAGVRLIVGDSYSTLSAVDGSGRRLSVDPVSGEITSLPGTPSDSRESSGGRSEAAGGESVPTAAYCLYTSGSTGRPKGVLGTHEGALNRLEWMWREFPLAHGEVVLQKTSLDFIDSVWEIFGALLAGHALVIADAEQVRDPERLAALVVRHPIGRIILVPTLLRTIMESPEVFSKGLRRIPRWFVTGELFASEPARRLLELHPTAELYNLYGTTETYDAACNRVLPEDLQHTVVPIGRPIDNMELHVLDSDLTPTVPGVRGELYVQGIGVAAGYLNRAQLSREKFLRRTESGSSYGSPLFRTGDIARTLPDGRVQCLGRLDNMVKVGGYRVEPEAVEESLRELAEVDDALVAAETSAQGEPRLVAYVTRRSKAPLEVAEIRRRLREKLPGWMIPTIVEVRDLPRTPSGKLSRAPVEPTPTGKSSKRLDSPGGTPQENRLREIWRELLNCELIDPNDDFFELGGTSLLAVRLATAIERELRIRLPLSVVFEAPTIRALARKLSPSLSQQRVSPVAIRLGSGDKLPLFSVPPAGTTVSAFGLLARSLPADQSLYSFQPRGIETGEQPHRSIEEMARSYVAEMKRVQPQGPYLVSGRCFGGYVAYEMAQQLIASGDRVAALIIIDSPEAPLAADEQRLHVGIRKMISYYPERMRYFFRRRMLAYTLWMKLRNEASYLIERLRSRLPFRLKDSRERRLQMLRHIHTLAYHRYVAKPFPGQIILFWADGLPDLTGEKGKWERLAQEGIEWYTFTTRHHDLLKEHNVQTVAAQLAECIERAQE